jgi:hypothetical protein
MKSFLIIFLIATLLGCSSKEAVENKVTHIDPKTKKMDSLVSLSRTFLWKGKSDSALIVIRLADSVRESIQASSALIAEIKKSLSKNGLEEYLVNLSGNEYRLLLKHNLKNLFFLPVHDSIFEAYLISQLYVIRYEREKLMKNRRAKYEKENAESKRKLALENEKRFLDGEEKRIQFSRNIQERYYDEELNIKVLVAGKHSENITLKFILINDVWVHHFQKGNMLTQLKEMGFRKITLTDGFDFTVYWDFHQ